MATLLLLHPGHGLDAVPMHHGEGVALVVAISIVVLVVFAVVRRRR